MDTDHLAERMGALESTTHSLKCQIDECKAQICDIHRLAVALERICVRVEDMSSKVDGIDTRLRDIENVPQNDRIAFRRSLATCVASALVSAVVALITKFLV